MASKGYKYAYSDRISPKSWRVDLKQWDKQKQANYETIFTLGNGYLCSRGVLEELPYDASAGTFIGGVYDSTGAQITELVNLPNPFNFRIDVNGEKLDPVAMDVMFHRRTLDMLKGTLFRNTVYKTAYKKRIDYRSRRFVSMHNRHIAVMEVEFTPLDEDMTISVQTAIDTSVYNKGTITEGRKKHYQINDVVTDKTLTYTCVETFEDKLNVAYASVLEICRKNRCRRVSERAMNILVHKGETITFRKIVAIKSSRHIRPSEIRRATINLLNAASKRGFDRLLEDHECAWAKRWKIANIEIEGDPGATKGVRFNIYHLIIAGNELDDDVSIGARTLSGEGYRGHIFWDTELFILPFFIYTNPKTAKNLLMYRYHRLDAARHIAAAKGYSGALFPWESAGSGQECTPSWARNFDGKIIKIVTMDEEHHIVADIAFAVDHYCKVTRDDAFKWKQGLEIMIETARFWRSRVTLNARKDRYEIHDVMGPDEFHESVNNNSYTNAMAKWNLSTAAAWVIEAKKKHKTFERMAKRLDLSSHEITAWKQIADRMYMPTYAKKKLIEPFEGFFRLRDHRIAQLDERLMPMLPSTVSWDDIAKTQFIKQADVVMLLYLLGENFSHADKKRNYLYNERRTLHKSSLSPAIHSIVGLEVGDEERALHYFAHSLSTDLNDIHGNTNEGIHAASAGGCWQDAIMGFAGMRPGADAIKFNPHIPKHWKSMRFCIDWRGCQLRVSISQAKTDICIEDAKRRGKVFAEVYGIKKELKPSEFVRFTAPERLSVKGGKKAKKVSTKQTKKKITKKKVTKKKSARSTKAKGGKK
jgi:kojibiose phosphorylase